MARSIGAANPRRIFFAASVDRRLRVRCDAADQAQ
jgi:hypothetical protein